MENSYASKALCKVPTNFYGEMNLFIRNYQFSDET